MPLHKYNSYMYTAEEGAWIQKYAAKNGSTKAT